MPRWVRHYIALACFLAAWCVVRPAMAWAPFCDESGASANAPLPTLDPPDESLDVGEVDTSCDGPMWGTTFERGDRGHRIVFSPMDEVVLTEAARDPVRYELSVDFGQAALFVARAGVRGDLERPPEALR
jgi:hypothetical protein